VLTGIGIVLAMYWHWSQFRVSDFLFLEIRGYRPTDYTPTTQLSTANRTPYKLKPLSSRGITVERQSTTACTT